MKTNLAVLPIESISEANKFIKNLIENNELFHFEDDIDQIEWNYTEVNPTELFVLKEIVRQLYSFKNYDPVVSADIMLTDYKEEQSINEARHFILHIASDVEIKQFALKLVDSLEKGVIQDILRDFFR